MAPKPRTVAVFVTLVLGGGCAPAPEQATPETVVASSPLSPLTEAWWAYERPEAFDVVRTDVEVPMRDGTLIGCDLSRPATAGRASEGTFPGLVVEFTPYVALTASYNA